jgi:hypothetical protein
MNSSGGLCGVFRSVRHAIAKSAVCAQRSNVDVEKAIEGFAAFALIADRAIATKSMTHIERMDIGAKITMDNLNAVNLKLHSVLYGLIAPFVETIEATTPKVEQMRVQVFDAPKPTKAGLPMLIDV